jgi:hypothetical protein
MSPDARARKLAALLDALPAEEMRRSALRDTLLALEPALAAELLHRLLVPDAPRHPRTSVAAATCVSAFSGGAALPYGFAEEIYAVASARGYEEVQRLLLRPGAQRQAAAEEQRPDPRVAELTLGERKSLARRHDPDLLERLLFDPDPAVLENLLRNPRITEREVVRIAAHRPGFASVLRLIAQGTRFSTRERVRRALARNPFTPTDVAVNLLPFLRDRDLREVESDGTLHLTVRRGAEAILRERKKARRGV